MVHQDIYVNAPIPMEFLSTSILSFPTLVICFFQPWIRKGQDMIFQCSLRGQPTTSDCRSLGVSLMS